VADAIASVRRHAPADTEIVVVDDGSVDGTGMWLRREYAGSVSCEIQPSLGRSAARNAGIRLATGDALVFLDSDDLVLRGGPQSLLAVLERDPAIDVAMGDGVYADETGAPIEPVSRTWPAFDVARMLEVLVLQNVIAAPHLAMVRRSRLMALAPPWFDESLHGGEDADFWVRLAAAGFTFGMTAERVGAYRLHPGGASSPQARDRSSRHASVVRGRLKILDAPFFGDLPASVRRLFLWELLVHDLAGRSDDQARVLASDEVTRLPAPIRADLLAGVAVENLSRRATVEIGRRRLSEAVDLGGASVRRRALLALSYFGPRATAVALRWRRRLDPGERERLARLPPQWRATIARSKDTPPWTS
jgi:GT2 family glycosyltransferase